MVTRRAQIGLGGSGDQSDGLPSVRGQGLVAALYLLEVLSVFVVLMVYRAGGKSSLGDFLISRPGLLCIGAGVVGCLTLLFIVWRCVEGAKSGSRQWLLGVAMNVLVVGGLVLVGEVGLRLASVQSNTQETIAGKLLYPRQWKVVVEKFKAILTRAKSQPIFLVEDADLGWTVGVNRRNSDGMYLSGAEGLRSARVGESSRTPSKCRIALVGDSYTFGEEVAYEDSWAYLLGREFGTACQVLNFGGPGYGIDQMYLRYMRDVRPWHPDAVVLAFVNHDVVRTLSVYSFLMFPDGEVPYAKPRFVVRGGQLVRLNHSVITKEEIFDKDSISRLPLIEHDVQYKEIEWDRPGWQWLTHSYIFRVLVSFYPLHEKERPEISQQVMTEVNQAIFKDFRERVAADGAKSLIVYLPTVEEFPERTWWEPLGLKMLREDHVPHLDLRECMRAKYTPEMYMRPGAGRHYSPQGNRSVAGCLANPIHSLVAHSES